MSDCIFCKIAGKEMGTELLYEDDKAVVFKDLYPKAPTHLLIVSKKHIPSVLEMEAGDDAIAGHLIGMSKMVAKDLGLEGYKLQINVGEAGGQEIFHIHVHLMSKFKS